MRFLRCLRFYSNTQTPRFYDIFRYYIELIIPYVVLDFSIPYRLMNFFFSDNNDNIYILFFFFLQSSFIYYIFSRFFQFRRLYRIFQPKKKKKPIRYVYLSYMRLIDFRRQTYLKIIDPIESRVENNIIKIRRHQMCTRYLRRHTTRFHLYLSCACTLRIQFQTYFKKNNITINK